MKNFEDTFETSKRSFISAFSICMTVLLKAETLQLETMIKTCVHIRDAYSEHDQTSDNNENC